MEHSNISFAASNSPRGTYLLAACMVTVGAGAKLTSVNCQVWCGNPCGKAKLPVPFVQPLQGGIVGGDFMRVRWRPAVAQFRHWFC